MARSRNPNLPKNTIKEIEEVVEPIPEMVAPIAGQKPEVEKETSKEKPEKLERLTKIEKAEKADKTDRSDKINKGEKIPKKEKSKDGSITNYFGFLQNERFIKVSGLTSLLTGVYLLIAFTSFYFSWQTDMDKVLEPGKWLISPQADVNNSLGKLGAMVSHLFLYKWFGIASYCIAFTCLNLGLKVIFNLELLPVGSFAKYSFFALIWIPVALNVLLPAYPIWGGGFGYFVNIWLFALVGKAGVFGLLAFTLLVLLVISINLKFYRFEKKPKDSKLEPIVEANLKANVSEGTPQVIVPEPIVSKLPESKPDEQAVVLANLPIVNKPIDLDLELEPAAKPLPLNEPALEEPMFTVVEKKPENGIEAFTKEGEDVGDLPFGEYDPTLELSTYKYPHLDLLDNHPVSKEATVNAAELNANKDKIVATLNNYGISIDKIKATIGPTVTLYEIVPSAGVRISKIKNLEDDIALSLSALGIRIIAPIPGKGTIGIEVPNSSKELVGMRSLLASDKFQNSKMDLPIALGKTIENETFIADLAKMPHLLMAGATGQGKSVGLNAILVSLLYKKHPSQIKFVLVDPKKVELTLFNKIERHFLAKLPDSEEAIITDTKKVIHTLNSLCIEMDQRYNLLKNAQVRNLKEYNSKFIGRKLNPNNGHKFLPYIVLVVDEFADLIMTAGKEVEMPIARLAQLARAVGIHLIIATQRPSVNIITGTIKANFPARIAFRVTSKIDSRTILDSGGADQLIGYGDMLLSTGNDLIRIQCAFVDTPEVEKICEFIGSQRGYPEAFKLPEYIDENAEDGGFKDADNVAERDSMFAEAARLVVSSQQGSASLLQRRLNLGYARAGRIIDQLEAAKIVGTHNGSKFRDVLIKDAATLEQFLKNSGKASSSPLDEF